MLRATSPPAVIDHVHRICSNTFNNILSGRLFSFQKTLSFRATSVKTDPDGGLNAELREYYCFRAEVRKPLYYQ